MTEELNTAGQNTAENALLSMVPESDNAFVKASLFLRTEAAALPSIGRGLWNAGGKRRFRAMINYLRNEYRPHPIAYMLIALMIFSGINFAQTHRIATGVSVDGSYIGAVDSIAVFDHAESYMRTAAAEALGEEYSFEAENLKTFPMIVANDNLIGEQSVIDAICEASSAVTYAYVLEINGQMVGAEIEEADIQAALKDKLNQYRNENTIAAEFDAGVTVTRQIVSTENVSDYTQIADVLNSTSQAEVVYTVEAGDTWGHIAAKHDMTSSELKALNPDFNIDRIWAGQEVLVSKAVPLLSVKTVERQRYNAPIDYDTEWESDPTMYKGETKVLTPGVKGVADVEAHVSYLDGVETSRNIISSVTIEDPVTEVIAMGTKERPKTMASGEFAWPTSGRVTSTFGGRKSPGGIGSTNHKGIDIANSRGTAIRAADGGTVSYAGWMSGYGYTVIIDHQNGYKTYYAHNSKLDVSVGTKVYKGQQIAKMGSTGRSTGNHCHFEIRLNGTPVNPMKYLP